MTHERAEIFSCREGENKYVVGILILLTGVGDNEGENKYVVGILILLTGVGDNAGVSNTGLRSLLT